jgi:putative inorganic carbon (HCO3(-)) transporter
VEHTPWHGSAYRYILAFLILLLPVQIPTDFSFRFAPSDVFLLLLLLFGGVHMKTSKEDWNVWHLLLLVVFSGAILNSALRYGTVTQWAFVNKYLGLLLLFLLYLVVVQYARSLPAIWRIARLVVLSIVLQAAFALPLYFVGLTYEPLHVPRIQGLMADPNAYGGLIVMALALHWATVNTRGSIVPRRLAWPATLLLLANLLFCFSRSSWIGFLFVVLAILVFRRRAWAHVLAPIVGGVFVVLVFFRSYFAEEIWPLVARPDQVIGRVANLEKATNTFLAHPITGSGLGSFLEQYGVQVHNTLFWMLAEMGMIGATIFIGFVLMFALRGYRAYRTVEVEYRGLVAGLLIGHVAMIGLSLGIEAFYQRSWWVVMALLNACWVVLAGKVVRPETSSQPTDQLAEGS